MTLKLTCRFFIAPFFHNTKPLFCYRFYVALSLLPTLSSRTNQQNRKNQQNRTNNSSLTNSTIQLLSICRNIKHLKVLKSHLIVRGLIRNDFFVGEFLKACDDSGVPDLALSTFSCTINPSLYVQNLIIRCLCNHGLFKDVLCVYSKCRYMNCPSDNFTFPLVITACSDLGSVQVGKSVHCATYRTGFDQNVFVQTALVHLYAKIGRMEIAETVFDRISKPDLVCWNALISGYSLNGIDDKVFEVSNNICFKGLKPNVSTLASVIPVCTRTGCTDKGKSLHGLSVKSGLLSNDYLVPALVSMYASDADLESAINLFNSSLRNDITIWNSIISAYVQNQEHNEAFRKFKLMLHANLKPSIVSFVSIIPSCENFGDTWIGEAIHACVVKSGFENQVSVATVLVSMYAKHRDLVSAKVIFHRMSQMNLLSWNCMVSGCVHNEDYGESLALFSEMQVVGFYPDAISIISILSACSSLEAYKQGKSVHAYSLKRGFDLNLNVSNALLAFYTDTHLLSLSCRIFNKMVMKNVISWNTIISGLVHIGEREKAIFLLKQLQLESIKMDLITLISILPCCNKTETLGQGMAVHAYAIKNGFASNVSLVNALISMYFNCGDLDSGKFLFDNMPERSVVSWNALITGYWNHNLQNEAMASFQEMIMEGSKPNYVTFLNVLPLCCTLLTGKAIHARAIRTLVLLQTPLLTSLISMYGKFENLRFCFALFEMWKKTNILFWNAIISVCVQTRNSAKAVEIFTELLHEREMKPDNVTVLSLISASAHLTNLNFTSSITAYVIRTGFNNDTSIMNALIDSLAKCGSISLARQIFEELIESDSISWSVMINAYSLHGDGETALSLLSGMEHYGVKPDEIVYLSVLSACRHAGLVEQGQVVFNCMLEKAKKGVIIPRKDHYACMVDLLARKGYLNEAYEIVKKHPCKPSSAMLESLLGSCKVHGNIQLGEEIGKLLYEIDPENPGLYVILCNMYASVGKWMNADRLRSYMEMRQLRKVAGSSQLK